MRRARPGRHLPPGTCSRIINHSPLEAFADHIYYMRLTCGHNPRCVRLGDAVSPLRPLDRSTQENLACVREGLECLARSVPPDQRDQEPVSKTIYLLVAGRISPRSAIHQLRHLIEDQVESSSQPVSIPEHAWR
jgi:hypothetical protein